MRTEVQLDIDKLNLQKKLLAEGKAGVQKRAEDAREQAALSLKEAQDIAKDLDRLVQSLMTRQDEIKAKFAAIGHEAKNSTPERFTAIIAAEVPEWAKIIAENNIKPE